MVVSAVFSSIERISSRALLATRKLLFRFGATPQYLGPGGHGFVEGLAFELFASSAHEDFGDF